MRIIGPPTYTPSVTCLGAGKRYVDWLHRARMRADRLKRAQNARRKREASLLCPDCGDGLKVRLKRRWVCWHCLGTMIVPAKPSRT